MTRAGMKDEVLGSFSIWVCASCYACTAACPKQIPITDIMYALKRTAIREGVHPKRFATPVLAREFVSSVDKWGRNTESRLAVKLYLKTRPTLLLEDAPLGSRLRRRGRMGLRREGIRHRAQFRAMLQSVEAAGRRAPPRNGARAKNGALTTNGAQAANGAHAPNGGVPATNGIPASRTEATR
jgi:heterodisulfide reductase subunit C